MSVSAAEAQMLLLALAWFVVIAVLGVVLWRTAMTDIQAAYRPRRTRRAGR